jgi:hypothetical protein
MTTHHETLVREVLHRATDHLTAPVPSLTATATVRGRRLRRRRRIGTVAGGLCAAALVAVPLVASVGSDSTAGTDVATDPTPSVTPTPAAVPQLVDNDAWASMPAAEMAAHFERLAPDGIGLTDVRLTNEDRAPDEPETKSPGYLVARVTTDGTVTGSANLILYVTGFSDATYTCPGNLTRFDSCTEILGEDGQPIGRRSVTTSGGVVVNEVVEARENGGLVYVAATNATSDKWGWGSPIAAPDAPLTLDQLQAIAEDDAWIGYAPPAGSAG